jgi:UDP:flavonoid glycosyltransferase YjiC (YdhE family)
MNDRSEWAGFLEEFDRTHAETWAAYDAWCREQGASPLPPRDFMHTSPVANLYVYPASSTTPTPGRSTTRGNRIDSSVREPTSAYVVPPELADRPADSGLIYLSLGSLGSADIALMQRLIDVLGTLGTG